MDGDQESDRAVSDEWVASMMGTWPKDWRRIRRLRVSEMEEQNTQLLDLDTAEAMAATEVEWALKRWPHATTECLATDRVYWRGLGNASRIMTGYGAAGAEIPVTYRGLGREFATAVLNATAATLRVVIYNASQSSKQAAVLPWLLEPGASYKVTVGEDRDFDGREDRLRNAWTSQLGYRGQELPVEIGPREQLILSVERSSRARRVKLTLMENDKQIGETITPNLEAPLDLTPKPVRVHFPFVPTHKEHTFTVRVSLFYGAPEISRHNNQVTLKLATPKVTPFVHSSS